jgi:hypothetical protein
VTFAVWDARPTDVIPAEAGTQYTEQRVAGINGGMAKQPCVYILASKRNGTLYIGVTSDLFIRVGTHKQDLIEGFTKRSACIAWSTTRCTRPWKRRSCARSG